MGICRFAWGRDFGVDGEGKVRVVGSCCQSGAGCIVEVLIRLGIWKGVTRYCLER